MEFFENFNLFFFLRRLLFQMLHNLGTKYIFESKYFYHKNKLIMVQG